MNVFLIANQRMLPRLDRSTRAALRHTHPGVRSFVHLTNTPAIPVGCRSRRLLLPYPITPPPSSRTFIGVVRIVRGLLKVRYIILGGAAAGGMTLNKKYDEWMDNLPDVKWIRDLMPDKENWETFRGSLISLTDKFKEIEIDPRLKQLPEEKYRQLKDWFDERLDAAIVASEKDNLKTRPLSDGLRKLSEVTSKIYTEFRGAVFTEASAAASTNEEHAAYDRIQAELDEWRKKYRQLERDTRKEQETLTRENKALIKENKEMRRAVELAKEHAASGIIDDRRNGKRIRSNIVDMYSEVLDELADFDTAYSGQDHLPRVVVVGDQSSGKTSVLEMIAQARIFPRGAGEMMTRAPVKVTLSEGPYHMAQFKDSPREYDLTNERDLKDLRAHVEERMRASVARGHTVSSKEIAMTVKGPGLQRMVLVDLPGIISTVTTDMAEDTKDAIRAMSMKHMSNPNAIILCVQDGSVDAERSNVTDLVSKMDPNGKRTIFVLTKVDLAEKQLASPDRIERILAGKLFPMKALGYFAVVTGRGRGDESIESIRSYEEEFFRRSHLFGSGSTGSVPATQVTTRNMSRAVSDCFWRMVSETVEQQADAFKAIRYNLETEWKNNFARVREMDRDELFVRARDEILDQVVSLGQIIPAEWERLITEELWAQVSEFVLEKIYLPALSARDSAAFNTKVDIVLREWASEKLPQLSVNAGWATLARQLQRSFDSAASRPEHDPLYDALKKAVIEASLSRHSWEKRALGVLRTLQTERLEDRVVADKPQWDEAVSFLEKSIKKKMAQADSDIREHMGPGRRERWLRWTSQTEEQAQHNRIRMELDKLLQSEPKHGPELKIEEVRMIQAALQLGGELDASINAIRETWNVLYRRHAWQSSLFKAQDCRKSYYMHQQGLLDPEGDCHDIVLFWRIQQVLKVSASALRNQVVNREARRLSDEIKEVLDEYGNDPEQKRTLLTGRRVQLAEDLKRVRRIQELLEEFIHSLTNEK